MDNIKVDGISTKIKWKIHPLFPLYFKFWNFQVKKRVNNKKYGLSIKDSRHLKNQSKNNNDNNNGDNNGNNTNLAGKLTFQVDTGKNVV